MTWLWVIIIVLVIINIMLIRYIKELNNDIAHIKRKSLKKSVNPINRSL